MNKFVSIGCATLILTVSAVAQPQTIISGPYWGQRSQAWPNLYDPITDIEIFRLRNDASPNRALYIGGQGTEISGLTAISLQIRNTAMGNTDPRAVIAFSDSTDGEKYNVQFREFSLMYNLAGGFYGYIYSLHGNNLHIGTNSNVTYLSGSSIQSEGNFVASAALATTPVSVALTADNQTVSTTNRSHIQLSSNDATAANRTFVLTPSNHSGQELTLEWTGTNAGEIADDSANTGGGNNRLSATWTPTQYDTLRLKFNGTDWVELSRSPN